MDLLEAGRAVVLGLLAFAALMSLFSRKCRVNQ